MNVNNRAASPSDRFKEIEDDTERLKKLADSDCFGPCVAFTEDKKELPFKGDISPHLLKPLEEWKNTTHPETPWEDFYLKTRKYLTQQRELYRDWIVEHEDRIELKPESPKHLLVRLALQMKTTKIAKKSGIIFKKDELGCGDAIYCYKKNQFLAVLKSVSGDPGAIDNPTGLCHPLEENFVRPCRSYQSSLKEAFAYELARLLGVSHTIPPTILTLVENDNFHSYYDNPSVQEFLHEFPEYKEMLIQRLGEASSERLCSMQKVIKNACTLEAFERNQEEINQENFEDVNFITRVLWETDGHKKNYLVKESKGEYFLYKIDSGFSFPKTNIKAQNSLIELKNAARPISERYRKKTLDIDCDKIRILAEKFLLQGDCIIAAIQRVNFMKELVQMYPDITHRQFELRLRMFGGFVFKEEIFSNLNIFTKNDITTEYRTAYALHPFSEKELRQLEREKLFGADHIDSSEEGFFGNSGSNGYATFY